LCEARVFLLLVRQYKNGVDSPKRIATSNRLLAAERQAVLSCPSDHFDLIHDLHDAINVGDDLLSQLRVIEGFQATFKHECASFGFAGDAS
jgi:hypothetical protein